MLKLAMGGLDQWSCLTNGLKNYEKRKHFRVFASELALLAGFSKKSVQVLTLATRKLDYCVPISPYTDSNFVPKQVKDFQSRLALLKQSLLGRLTSQGMEIYNASAHEQQQIAYIPHSWSVSKAQFTRLRREHLLNERGIKVGLKLNP